MDHCLWCDEEITKAVSWHEVFGMSKQETLCYTCRDGLAPLPEPLCRICGRSLDELPEVWRQDDLCFDCIRWEKSSWGCVLEENRSLYRYNSFLKEVIARFKFRGDVVMVNGFSENWLKLYHQHFSGKLPVPIPLSKERLYERGFNQALELARLLPVAPHEVLERVVHEAKQSKKSRTERLRLEAPVFRFIGDPSIIYGKEMVLIDDIYTTGATVRRAAKVLLENGAASVCSMTVARG